MAEPTARRGLPRAVAAVAAAIVLVGVGVVVGGGHAPTAPDDRTAARERVATSVDQARLRERQKGVNAVLAERARAVLAHDRAAFLATVDPQQPAFRTAQEQLFDNLAKLPLAEWRYDLQASTPRELPPDLAARYGPSAYSPAAVELHYRLADFDQRSTTIPQHPTFVQRNGHWLVAGEDDLSSLRTVKEPWDFGPVSVLDDDERVLVIGHPGEAPVMRTVADEVARAIPRVTAVWGTDWARRVVVVVPRSQDEMHSLVGEYGDLSQIAAVATAELGEGSSARSAGGDRILVNPANFAKLGPVGRRVVLTHEVTHVATRVVTPDAMPDWLVEGFADLVGYRGTGVSVPEAARELATEVRAGKVPAALPADSEFAGGNDRLPQVYEEAWLACRMVADRYGEQTAVRLYRAVGQSSDTGTAAAADGLHTVLGVTLAQFTAQWRDYVRASLS